MGEGERGGPGQDSSAAVPWHGAAAGRATSQPLLGGTTEPTLRELSQPGRVAWSLPPCDVPEIAVEEMVPLWARAEKPPALPEVAERDLVAHWTRLAHRNYAVDLGAYPLGSCTMKYNPKVADDVGALPGFTGLHPCAPESAAQGTLALMADLEAALCEITGMAAATLQPAAGAAGELTGLLLMRAAHEARGDVRRRVIIPDAAHGTNPASVRLAGYEVVSVPSTSEGLVDVAALRGQLDSEVAGLMLTNPNTVGLFESEISEIADAVHAAGGLLYYDGANLNAILGIARPGDMGFDIVHSNLHKTFATPHGGGGPGAGPVAVSRELAEFLPGPRPCWDPEDGCYRMVMPARSIGRVHAHQGNAGVLVRAFAYIVALGPVGLRRAADVAVLNARYLQHLVRGRFPSAYQGPCMHEFVATAGPIKKATGVRAMDIAKALLDRGFHAPTVYFPLIVDEALMVEPTETESRETIEALAAALLEIGDLAESDPEALHRAPERTPVRRPDEARAARRLRATWLAPVPPVEA
jgi:glycine cleavage system P protein (glycine dehydrogenase) subunit 2